MDDRTPVNESSGEMEDSPKGNDDCEDAFQDKPDDSGRDPATLGNQVIPSIRQNASENQQLPSGISAEMSSGPFLPTSASSSQAQNIDQLDETLSSTDVFYSSRKFRIRTKCSRSVDAVISNRQHLTAFQDKSEESSRNPTTLGIQVLPSFRQDPTVNKQLPSAISAETSSRTSASSSQALNIDQLDETISSRDVFYSSRDLRIRTNCSRRVDALLSPRQNSADSSMPVLECSDVGSAKINRRVRSALGEGRNTDSVSPPQPPPFRVTRSLSKTRNMQKTPTPTPSPEKRSVETGIAPTSTKRRRTLTPESDSGKSGTKNESFRSKFSPSAAERTLDKSPINVQTREKRATARESEASESLASPLTPSNKKRKIMESICSDSKTANDAFESSLSFPISAAHIDHKSPTNLQPQESKVAVRNFGESESATEGKTSITSRDCLTDSNPLAKHSNPHDLHQTRSFINLSTEEHEATTHSNISTDASSASPNKDSRKQIKISLALVEWTVESLHSPEKETVSLKLRRIPTDKASSSNLEPISNPQNSTTEDCQPCMEVKTQKFSSLLSEETESASNIAHSATEVQMLESSRSRPIIENPDLPSSPSKGLDSGIETQGFKSSPFSRIFSNLLLPLSCHLPEQSSSSDINVPHQVLELETDDEKGGTDRNRSDSSTRISKPNVKPRWESKKSSTSVSLEMLQTSLSDETLISRNLSKIQDHPEVLMQENRSNLLLKRQLSGSISSGVSTSRERSEVGMDLDPAYIDVWEGQPSTSSHQPVITDGSPAGDRFNSSSRVRLSGETRGRAVKSNTKGLSKYASNAQMLLLTVLEEMMKFNEEKDVYRKFNKLFLENSEFSCFETEFYLKDELMLYLAQRQTAWNVENVFMSREITLEYHAKEAYEDLICIVVTTLVSTVSVRSSLEFDKIMMNYRILINLYERCSQFWRLANVEDIQDEDSRNRVAFLKEMIQRLLLQTRNAFRELLMHIGEHADLEIIDEYEKELLEEDKKFLRRQI